MTTAFNWSEPGAMLHIITACFKQVQILSSSLKAKQSKAITGLTAVFHNGEGRIEM